MTRLVRVLRDRNVRRAVMVAMFIGPYLASAPVGADPVDLPSPLRMNVSVSATPTLDEATTVLMLATFAVRRDLPESPLIQVTSPEAGLEATSPFELEPSSVDVRLEASRDQWNARPGHRPASDTTRWSFEALGHAELTLRGAGTLSQKIAFSQADLGGPVADAVVHLVGSHTGLAPGASADLSVVVNGGRLSTISLDSSGRFTLSTRVPGGLLRRDNTLTLRVVTPPGHALVTVQFDPSSHLAVTRGQTLTPGFERFPQALLPSFLVAFDRLTPQTLQAAAQVVAVLQRLTRVPLVPRAVEWREALASEKPLLAVAAEPSSAQALEPPLIPSAFRLLDGARQEVLRLDPRSRFAMLQAFTTGRRDVLLLTHSAWSEGLIPLTQGLTTGHGWYGLGGDLWIVPSDRLPFSLRLRGSGFFVEPIPAPRAVWWDSARRSVFLGATLLVSLFLLWSHPRLVRGQPCGLRP